MKSLLSRLLVLGLVVSSLFALNACQQEEAITVPDGSDLEMMSDPTEISGADVIKAVEAVHGDVSKLTFEEVLDLFAEIKVAERVQEARGQEKATAESSQDVYSTFLSIFFIPYQGAPASQYITFYDTTPPIIGLPPVDDTRQLVVKRCPGFFQITCIANAFKNNTIISGQSATRSNNPSCGGRSVRGTARATITTFGSATTFANIDCAKPFCLIEAEEELEPAIE